MKSSPRSSRSVVRRPGNTMLLVVAALVVVAVGALLTWWFLGRTRNAAPQVLISRVAKGPYDYVVIEQGQVESASNIELRCEVRSRGGGGGGGGSSGGGGGGVTIIDVIPEGTRVAGPVLVENPVLDEQAVYEEIGPREVHGNAVDAVRTRYPNSTIKFARKIVPAKNQKETPFDYHLEILTNDDAKVVLGVKLGTLLVRLDSSALEQERVTQLIKVNGQKSLVVQAENALKAAEIALQEYLEGTFKQEEKLILAEVFVAEQGLRTAQLAFDSAQRLAAKGLLSGLQLEGEQIAVDNARNTLEIAQSKLRVLRELTKKKMETTFNSDIASARAKVANEQSSLALEEDKLRDIDDQIRKCTIYAPANGEVVYANEYDSWRGSSVAEFIVVAGSTVRERQAIIRLPDSDKMQVKATVNEARITLIRPGLPVTIRVDALKDQLIQGVVKTVNQYAEPGGYSSGNVRKYATYIEIADPPPGLRSGMNAEVRIHVERKSDALQVPVQAVAEHKGKYFALVQNGDTYQTREIQVGSSNDKVITIEGGLGVDDAVVMNPRGLGGLFELPELPDQVAPAAMADIARTAPNAAPVRPVANAGDGRGGGGPGRGGVGPGDGGPGGGGPGGEGGRGKGKGKGRGNFSPAMLVDRYLESDADKDGKLSQNEIATMDDRRKQGVADADKNSDGFLDRAELTGAAVAAMQRRGPGGGGPGGPGGPGGDRPALGGGE
jgi:RND family efflux transporter MFP subunit